MCWPSAPLSVALAIVPHEGVHAALVAQTDRGDFVLDNLNRNPRRLSQLDYTWVARQSGADLTVWARAGLRSQPLLQYAGSASSEKSAGALGPAKTKPRPLKAAAKEKPKRLSPPAQTAERIAEDETAAPVEDTPEALFASLLAERIAAARDGRLELRR
jgi:Bacterial transglutaminase-like cysteine proteinase BTLCP